MQDITLHVGRHKSGTTTIQKFLHSNRELLASRGYYYPDFGKRVYAHHEIGELLSRQSSRQLGDRYQSACAESRQSFSAEVSDISERLIISSESFQNCEPIVVRDYFEGYRITPVVYLREQVGYLVSSYAQRVHATNYSGSIEDFYDEIFSADYHRFLQGWKDVFGAELVVRIFDRKTLLKNDIVYDFVQGILKLTESDVTDHYVESDANPTLTPRLLQYKLLLNRLNVDAKIMRRYLYHDLASLCANDDSGKVIMSKELLGRVLNDCDESNQRVAREYFDRDQLFERSAMKCGDTYSLTRSDVIDIKRKLVKTHPTLASILPDDLDGQVADAWLGRGAA